MRREALGAAFLLAIVAAIGGIRVAKAAASEPSLRNSVALKLSSGGGLWGDLFSPEAQTVSENEFAFFSYRDGRATHAMSLAVDQPDLTSDVYRLRVLADGDCSVMGEAPNVPGAKRFLIGDSGAVGLDFEIRCVDSRTLEGAAVWSDTQTVHVDVQVTPAVIPSSAN